MENKEFEINTRTSIYGRLRGMCPFAEDHDFIEVTRWTNLEGYDIVISGKLGNRTIPLTIGEFELMARLITKLGSI